MRYTVRDGSEGPGRPVRRVVVDGHTISETAWKVYLALKADSSRTPAEIAAPMKLTRQRVYQCFRELEAAGLLEQKKVYVERTVRGE